jgi:cytochrome P450
MVALLAGANRDPAVFADPDRFDVTRENARDHVSFSAGRHYCLGAALARMEGEVGLRTLFSRYPDLRVERGAVRRSTRILRGFEHLPVTLRP